MDKKIIMAEILDLTMKVDEMIAHVRDAKNSLYTYEQNKDSESLLLMKHSLEAINVDAIEELKNAPLELLRNLIIEGDE